MRNILQGIAILIVGLGSIFLFSFIGFQFYQYFAPKYVEVERRIFEESRSFNEGMLRDFENLKMQYYQTADNQRAALKATIIHRFSIYPIDKLPGDLQIFYNDLLRSNP